MNLKLQIILFYIGLAFVFCQDQQRQNGARKLLPSNCGDDSSNRIVGGNETLIGEFPWKVVLQFRRHYDGNLLVSCSGSIINKRYILTVAHCLNGGIRDYILEGVRLGEYRKSTDPDCEPDVKGNSICADNMVFAEIEQEIIHENYNKQSSDQHNDIALLRLSRDITFTNFIKPICLPDRSAPYDKFYLVGWGRTETGSESDIPLKILLPLVPRDQCQVAYGPNTYRSRNITESQICAGGENGKDACSGDSGSPLMQPVRRSDESLRWTQYGLVSYGMKHCGTDGVPGVYTNVEYYMPWILSKLEP